MNDQQNWRKLQPLQVSTEEQPIFIKQRTEQWQALRDEADVTGKGLLKDVSNRTTTVVDSQQERSSEVRTFDTQLQTKANSLSMYIHSKKLMPNRNPPQSFTAQSFTGELIGMEYLYGQTVTIEVASTSAVTAEVAVTAKAAATSAVIAAVASTTAVTTEAAATSAVIAAVASTSAVIAAVASTPAVSDQEKCENSCDIGPTYINYKEDPPGKQGASFWPEHVGRKQQKTDIYLGILQRVITVPPAIMLCTTHLSNSSTHSRNLSSSSINLSRRPNSFSPAARSPVHP
ncbi:Hypp6180 [Branchiostoma lanceolatum]|uniref:Hypp6180 protein n=1 Tax=Branchiostoma lanceolatum TaxID=7740 RepID=A0A8J9YSS0_BRALA|nr:Hypp6180 [Branchiostoma lanceolatum]